MNYIHRFNQRFCIAKTQVADNKDETYETGKRLTMTMPFMTTTSRIALQM
jgi:hypothetical protein